MIIGPRYKIARRVGAPVFEKTQTQKFVLSQSRKTKTVSRGGPRQRSDYGIQLTEKQKARYTYLMSERQFANFVRRAVVKKGNTTSALYSLLEERLDNVVYRMGLASTRAGSRQMVSHGHITLNGRRVTIPSMHVKEGDSLGIRGGSAKKPLFQNRVETLKDHTPPAWIKIESDGSAKITGRPNFDADKAALPFDLNAVIEFYSR